MSYSKLKVSSQEKKPLSVYFPSAKSYFSFDSQTACILRLANGAVAVGSTLVAHSQGKPGSGVIIHVLRCRRVRWEGWFVSP